MSPHTLVLDVADAKERRILDRLLADCGPEDALSLDFRGDRIVIQFAPR